MWVEQSEGRTTRWNDSIRERRSRANSVKWRIQRCGDEEAGKTG